MGISGNMQSLSQLCACYGVPRVTQGFTTLFIGETFAVYILTVKLGNKERFDKEQIDIKEPFPVTNLPFTS